MQGHGLNPCQGTKIRHAAQRGLKKKKSALFKNVARKDDHSVFRGEWLFSSSHVWMWVYVRDYKESWAPKKWCFWTVVLEKTLESPLDCKETQRLMLKLKRQHFGHLMRRADSFEKTLMLGKIEGKRRRGRQRTRWLDGIQPTQWPWAWVNSRSWWWTRRPSVLRSTGS